MRKIVILILTFVLTSITFAHKHYMSIANMEYNSKLRQLEVSLKLTAHDFEHILESQFNRRIHIDKVSDSSKIGQFMISYLSENIKLYSGNTKAVFNYVGKEVDVRDQLFFYFTFTKVLDPSHIILENSILFKLFSKQQNLLHYKYKGQTKSVTCTNINPKGEIKNEN
ncbi:MAG: DUF6702 family protein [Crocinitomicaceae bacterium]